MFLIIYLLFCLVVAWCAKGSRGGPVIYFFASVIVTPFIALLFLVILGEDKSASESAELN